MKTQVISFQCVLKNKLGRVLSTSLQSDVINTIEHSGELKDLALGLQDVFPGEKRRIEIKAEQAYGFYKPELCSDLPRSELSRGSLLKVGDSFPMYSPEKNTSLVFRVIAATDETITVDGNHPLAGQDLLFDVEILEARELREEDEGDYLKVSNNHKYH